ncbi:hypothetical protein Ddc_09755 [Ditylenchus destructor]|nr:hypothetical protein Ddc_09755 [Ditylenchus destructor]
MSSFKGVAWRKWPEPAPVRALETQRCANAKWHIQTNQSDVTNGGSRKAESRCYKSRYQSCISTAASEVSEHSISEVSSRGAEKL